MRLTTITKHHDTNPKNLRHRLTLLSNLLALLRNNSLNMIEITLKRNGMEVYRHATDNADLSEIVESMRETLNQNKI